MAAAGAATPARLYATMRWWLVEHPAVAAFEWKPLRTWGSSPFFAASAVLAYLVLTLLLRPLLLHGHSTPLRRRFVRLISPLHNAFLLLLSLAMAVGCSLAAAAQMPSPSWLFCFPPSSTSARGPVFFWAYAFYLSKLVELVDTLLILLAADSRRLSFLHVYHHAVVVVMCYLWLTARQSLLPVALVTNASVHVVMYGYYLCSSLGWRWPPRWKRAVTSCQIVQFCFSFAVSMVFLWLHFFGAGGDGCSGFWAWVFNAFFNASLLALFLDFRKTNYRPSKLSKPEDKAH
ncbi:hypothetical protein Taro_007089 [Colocasia esculenta]|uniref:very-long-chain 3-oxoacyl-CoA synthase n=1 Tax=Colocasia esculenta TaxID=4460 RepID=A0A843TT31_COLES|nr:hypothetical protein [Colocasia esculenta]